MASIGFLEMECKQICLGMIIFGQESNYLQQCLGMTSIVRRESWYGQPSLGMTIVGRQE